jgi:hypothetical protein
MAKGIFNGFAQRVLATAVCAFAFVSGGAQAAPNLSSTSPSEISAGTGVGNIFTLSNVTIGESGTFDIRWSVRFLTSGGLRAGINLISIPTPQTTSGLYSSNADNELGSLVVSIPIDGQGSHFLEWTYLNAGYYLFRVEGISSSELETQGQGRFREQDPATDVPIPATAALLGLGLVGIGAARRKRV